MKVFKIALIALFLLTMILPINSQENSVVPKRTPEQEAIKQTEKLQQELNLSQDQSKRVYEINLRYARERQISNKRSDAMERMKNKNVDIQRVLSPEQNERLQSKRYERTYLETNSLNRNQQVNSSGYRSSSSFRTNRPVRIPGSSNMNNRNSYRPVNPDFHPGGQRSTVPSSNRYQYNSSSLRPSSGSSPYTPRRNETVTPSHNNPTRSSFTPGRSDPSTNSNRK